MNWPTFFSCSFKVDIQGSSWLYCYENSCFYYHHSFIQQSLLESDYVSITWKATADTVMNKTDAASKILKENFNF